jgi:hypothetical protein
MIDRVVPFESFRAEIEAAVRTPVDEEKSNGRKPIDVIVMSRMSVLQSRYNLFPASRSTIKCATACRSRSFCGSASRTAFRTARRWAVP